ncbi:hypothetical protein HWV62_2537 [Athelia sp. TMB]|nr:hypothetical protein HWV62_2537 [Athelia sp. TMB]
MTKISLWAQRVQPGSPAPRSPFGASPLAPPPMRTPSTAGAGEFKVDLASVGYAAMFVSFASAPLSAKTPTPAPMSTKQTLLRPRSNSTSAAKPKRTHALPAPAANDVALVQLLDGGKAPLALRVPDEAEALEYRPLLSPPCPSTASTSAWVRFSAKSGLSLDFGGNANRESVDSDLRSARAVLPREADPAVPTSLPPALRSRNILAVPARGGGVGGRNPAYLAEIELAFPKTPTSPSGFPAAPKSANGSVRKRRGSTRGRGRRPAPLNLAPLPAPPVSPRGEFLGASFAPSPCSPRASPSPRACSRSRTRLAPKQKRAPIPAPPSPAARKDSSGSDATLCAPAEEKLQKAGAVWEAEVGAGRRVSPLPAPVSPRGEFLGASFAPSPCSPSPRVRSRSRSRLAPKQKRAPIPAPPSPTVRKNSESSDATLCAGSDAEGGKLQKAGAVWEAEVGAGRRVVRKKPSMALRGVRRMFGRA